MKLWPEAYCGHTFAGTSTLLEASESGYTLFKDQPRDPDSLGQLILALKRDGYMCRECVREHFVAVGGIPGLFHHEWTEDLHRDQTVEDETLESAHTAWRIIEEGEQIEVFLSHGGHTQIDGECPGCGGPLIAEEVHEESVLVSCAGCPWKATFSG